MLSYHCKGAIEDRGCSLLKQREFVYVGEPIPKIDKYKNADFLLNLQKSMLLSLARRKLLNTSQMERVMDEIERQHCTKMKQKPS